MSNTPNLQSVVEGLLRRAEPLVYGLTVEQERCRNMLTSLGAKWVELPLLGDVEHLISIVENQPDGTLFLSEELYFWLDGERGSAALQKLLSTLERNEKSVWLLGTEREVPGSLQRLLVRVELPLPTLDELAQCMREEAGLSEGTSQSDEQIQEWVALARGFTLREWKRLLTEFDHETGHEGISSRIQAEKSRLLKTASYLELESVPESIKSLGGLDVLKEWLSGRKSAFGPEAQSYGLPQPKGLLLLGIQGCGKSLSAKAIASSWSLPLARLDLGQLFRSNSSPEAALRDTLRSAESLAPMVLWIDEIDKTFSGLDAGASDSLRRLFGSFITWLQEKQAPVFVVATANEVQGMPPELLRKGRFDEIFFVDLPDPSERRDIFGIHLSRHGRSPSEFDLHSLSAKSEFFSGAEIAETVVSALYASFAERRELEQADLLMAVQETVPLYFTYEERIKAFREWASDRARNASRDKRVLDLFRTD